MATIIRFINKICAELCGWMLSVVMILLLVDIICRTFATPIMGVAELAMFVMIGTVYAGLANCEMDNGHVRVGSLVDLLPTRQRHMAMALTYLVAAVAIGLAAWAACDNAWDSFIDKEGIAGAINYPLYPVKFVMGFGMVLYVIQILINFVAEIKKI